MTEPEPHAPTDLDAAVVSLHVSLSGPDLRPVCELVVHADVLDLDEGRRCAEQMGALVAIAEHVARQWAAGNIEEDR